MDLLGDGAGGLTSSYVIKKRNAVAVFDDALHSSLRIVVASGPGFGSLKKVADGDSCVASFC